MIDWADVMGSHIAGLQLSPSRVQFAQKILDWRSAIRLVGAPLVAEGVVEPNYLDEVINTAKKMGPYFDLGKGVAMPHARPEAGVHEIGISLLKVDPVVHLLDLEDHPIEIFIMLAATDANSHLDVLRELAQVLMVPEQLQALKDAATTDDVLAVFGGAGFEYTPK